MPKVNTRMVTRVPNPWVPSNLRGTKFDIPSILVLVLLGYGFYKVIDGGWGMFRKYFIKNPVHG